jgi:hypothetical protein
MAHPRHGICKKRLERQELAQINATHARGSPREGGEGETHPTTSSPSAISSAPAPLSSEGCSRELFR